MHAISQLLRECGFRSIRETDTRKTWGRVMVDRTHAEVSVPRNVLTWPMGQVFLALWSTEELNAVLVRSRWMTFTQFRETFTL